MTRTMPITVQAGDRSYDVLVGSQLLQETGALLAPKLGGRACAVISDDNVAHHFAAGVMQSLATAGFRPVPITVSPGEKSKSLSHVETICARMSKAGLDRSSFLIALGGGMVGDLAGFAGAIYHRGIPHVQMPTTLLAQVDSSIGGKTAINTVSGKNLIGAWHHPALVISDVDTLDTLPPREWRQGFAEIVKHAVIRDAEMFATLQQFDRRDLVDVVRRNIEIKAAIVAADERETTGERALLNFGHTIGHAIERAGEYGEFLHGEAVSLGIVAACEISVRKAGLTENERGRILDTLRQFELPTSLPPAFSRKKFARRFGSTRNLEMGRCALLLRPASARRIWRPM